MYGKIVVTNRAIRNVADASVKDCYGVERGNVKHIQVEENKIYLSIHLWLKFGVTPEPVCESVRQTIRYNIENFSGMSVKAINIQVRGIRG